MRPLWAWIMLLAGSTIFMGSSSVATLVLPWEVLQPLLIFFGIFGGSMITFAIVLFWPRRRR